MAELRAVPHAITCSAAVGPFGRGGPRQSASELLRPGAESHLEPDAIVCSAAASTWVKRC
eukprot:98140-Alexandrium_andersonii.AAC.1